MNILNRILIVILILFLLILSLVAMLNTFLPLIDIGDMLNRFADYYNSMNRWVLLFFWLIFFFVCFALLILEFIGKKPKAVKMVNVKEGKATMSLSSIGKQIHNDVMNVSNIQSVRVGILPKRSGIITNLDLGVEQGLDLTEKTREIVEVVKSSANRLGVKLYNTNVNFIPVSGPKIRRERPEIKVEERVEVEDISVEE
ncbi:MAG: hypothetical protein WBA71_04995 [Candidatus Humimicrobiia bacterium]